VIHPREQDLVIGTFGRSAYIIDDIRPLRALAREHDHILNSNIYAVEPPVAYLADTKNAPGYYFTGDAYFEGDNRSTGARISYFARVDEESESKKKDSVTILIKDQDMKLIRTLKSVPENGLNRAEWYLDRWGVRLRFTESGENKKSGNRESGGGGYVLPGAYNVLIGYIGDTVSTTIEVKTDPRFAYDLKGMVKKQEKTDLMIEKLTELKEALDAVRKCSEEYKLVKKLTGDKASDELKEISKSAKGELDRITKLIFRDESIQGIYYPSNALYVRMGGTYSITGASRPLTGNQLQKYEQYMSLSNETIEMINLFLETEWNDYKNAVNDENVSLFKD